MRKFESPVYGRRLINLSDCTVRDVPNQMSSPPAHILTNRRVDPAQYPPSNGISRIVGAHRGVRTGRSSQLQIEQIIHKLLHLIDVLKKSSPDRMVAACRLVFLFALARRVFQVTITALHGCARREEKRQGSAEAVDTTVARWAERQETLV